MNIDRVNPKPPEHKYVVELNIDEFNTLETALDLLFKSMHQLYPCASPEWLTRVSTMKAQVNTTH